MNLSNIVSLKLDDIERIIKELGYNKMFGVACAIRGFEVPLQVDMIYQFIETKEECAKMIEDAIHYGF